MTKLSRASIVKGRSLAYEADASFDGCVLPYPIHDIKKCHYEATINKRAGYDHAKFRIKCVLGLYDSRNGAVFEKPLELTEEADLLTSEDDNGEGYLVLENTIDLDDIALRIIVSSLPLKVVRDSSALPQGGRGYRVLSEEEKAAEKAESTNPAFDKLVDFPTPK
jgi:hypothetical protein